MPSRRKSACSALLAADEMRHGGLHLFPAPFGSALVPRARGSRVLSSE